MNDNYFKNVQQLNMGSYGMNDIRSGSEATRAIKQKKGEKCAHFTDLTTGDCYGGYDSLDGYNGGLIKKGFKAQFKYDAFVEEGAANVPVGTYNLDGLDIPDNHLLTKCFVVVPKAFVGAGASLAFSIENESADFLLAATGIASFDADNDIVELIPDAAIANAVITSGGGGRVTMTISGAAITAGDLLVFGQLENLNLSN